MTPDLIKAVIPDQEVRRRIDRDYPNEPAADRYELAQAFTLLYLAKARTFDELDRMAETGLLGDLVELHNEAMHRRVR
jgi:hypothetical protein